MITLRYGFGALTLLFVHLTNETPKTLLALMRGLRFIAKEILPVIVFITALYFLSVAGFYLTLGTTHMWARAGLVAGSALFLLLAAIIWRSDADSSTAIRDERWDD